MHSPNKCLCVSSIRLDLFLQNGTIHVASRFAKPIVHDVELCPRSEPRVNENEEPLAVKERLVE